MICHDIPNSIGWDTPRTSDLWATSTGRWDGGYGRRRVISTVKNIKCGLLEDQLCVFIQRNWIPNLYIWHHDRYSCKTWHEYISPMNETSLPSNDGVMSANKVEPTLANVEPCISRWILWTHSLVHHDAPAAVNRESLISRSVNNIINRIIEGKTISKILQHYTW